VVLCQLLMAPLFAWFLEWRSTVKELVLPQQLLPGVKRQIVNAEMRPLENRPTQRRVRQLLLSTGQISHAE
jgi:hypothetical protein